MRHALLFTRSVLGAGICAALRDIPNWTVLHCATQCPEHLVELASSFRPTVTLFDMTCLQVVDFFQLLGQKRVKELFPAIVVATLAGLTEEDLFHLSMWGVAAHISGDTEPGDLAGILQRVLHGEYLLTEECLRKARIPALCPRSPSESTAPLIGMSDNTHAVTAKASPLRSPLTAREADVLCCIAQGMTNSQVARSLGIRENTVKNYMTAIFAKLEVRDRTSAVVCALRQHWIQVPEVPPTGIPRAAVA
jgi:two-component system response regulator DegU